MNHRIFFRNLGALLFAAALLPLGLQAQTPSLPKLALQYWQPGDYPNREYGHDEQVWVEGHEEDGSMDEDGNWTSDGTHWVDEHYETRWVIDGYYADGQFGSRWDTTLGDFNLSSSASTYSMGAVNRGYVLQNGTVYGGPYWFRISNQTPSNNCNNFSYAVYDAHGNLIRSESFGANTARDVSFVPTFQGTWRIDIAFHYATGVAPDSGTVSYFFAVGPIPQAITFVPIPSHARDDPPFPPIAFSDSGRGASIMILSGPATFNNGLISLSNTDGTVSVMASENGGMANGVQWAAASPVIRTFTVAGLRQTISFPAIADRMYGSGAFSASATSTSSLPVTLSIISGPATLAGNTVTLTGSGTVTIRAAQAGNSTYAAADPVTRTFVSTPDTIAPSTPTGLTATNVTYKAFTLTWSASTDGAGVTGYEVRRNGTSLGVVTGPTSNNTGLTPSTTYTLDVRARDAAGNWSPWSSPTLNVTTAPITAPRLAVQYWQQGDYPGKPYGHTVMEWEDAHWDYAISGCDSDAMATWSSRGGPMNDLYDQDGNYHGELPDFYSVSWTWYDGKYEPRFVQDGEYADGEFGSKWATNLGNFDIATSASGYTAANANRGTLTSPFNVGFQVLLRSWAQAPSDNCTAFAWRIYRPNGTYDSGGSIGLNSYSEKSYYPQTTGVHRLEIDYQNADGVTPTTGTVTYYVAVGSSQSIDFAAIPDHAGQDAPFAISATASSGMAVSYTLISGPATISGNTVTITGYGDVTIRATQNGGTSSGTVYAAALNVDRTFTVRGLSHSIAFPIIPDHVFGDTPFALSATDSVGLPVSYAVTAGPATISGSSLTLTGAGSVTVTASQSGNSIYGPAPAVTRTFTVAKANQTISFPAIAAQSYGSAPFTPAATASSGLPVTRTVVSGPATVTTNGQLALTGLGTIVVSASQAGSTNYNAAPSVTQSFVVNRMPGVYYLTVQDGTAGSGGVIYGAPGSTVSLTASAPPSNCTFTSWSISTGQGTVSPPTNPSAVFTFGAADATVAANYEQAYALTVQNGTANGINKANGQTVTLTANADSGSQFFSRWRIVSGPGGIANASARTTTFTFGPGPTTVTAEFLTYNTVSLIPQGFDSGASATKSPSGGIRGTEISIVAPAVPTNKSFDGWWPMNSGMVVNSAVPSSQFIMGSSTALVTLFAADQAYVAARLRASFSVHSQTVAVGQTVTLTATGIGGEIDGVNQGISRLVMEWSADYGDPWSDTWTTAHDGDFTGLSGNSATRSVSATRSSQTTLLVRVRAERPEVNVTYVSLYDYARIVFLEAGTLEVRQGTGSGTGITAGTVVPISATPVDQKIFTGWKLVSGTGTIANPAAMSTTFTMGGMGAIIQAEFSDVYTLTVANGTPGTATGLLGAQVQITANADTGSFLGWTFENGGPEAGSILNCSATTTTFTFGNGHAKLRANYPGTDQKLLVFGGTPAVAQQPIGSTVAITAGSPPNGPFYFAGWRFISAQHGTINPPTSTVPTYTYTFGLGDSLIEPNWAPGYSLTVLHGSAARAGGPAGDAIAILAAPPQPGYAFDHWILISGSGSFSDANQPSTLFTLGTADAVIDAVYRPSANEPVVTGLTVTGTAGTALVGFQVPTTNNPNAYLVISGSLPPGVSLNPSSGWITGTPTAGGTFEATIQASNASGTSYATFVFVIASSPNVSPPTITQQPTNKTTPAGVPVTFSVTATGSGSLSYQWQKNGLDLTGATSASLVIASPQPASAGMYQVVVRNAGGSVKSNSVTLTVTGAPTPGDSDGDGIPDAVEIALGLNPNDPTDAVIQIFTYDKLGRLKTGPGGEYVKDAEGNIKEVKP